MSTNKNFDYNDDGWYTNAGQLASPSHSYTGATYQAGVGAGNTVLKSFVINTSASYLGTMYLFVLSGDGTNGIQVSSGYTGNYCQISSALAVSQCVGGPASATPTFTLTATQTVTRTITLTLTNTPVFSATNTMSVTPTVTPSMTKTNSQTVTSTNTQSAMQTATQTVTPGGLNTCAQSDNFDDNSIASFWTSTDIGTVSSTNTTESGSALNLVVSGNGINGATADNIRFVYQKIDSTTDFIITLKVNSISSVNDALTGIMVRDSLAAGSDTAFMAAGGNEWDYGFFYRESTNGTLASSTHGCWGCGYPRYIELVKTGSSIGGYESSNGTTWIQQGTTRTAVAFDADMYVGIAASSNYGSSSSSTVDDFNFTCFPAGTSTYTPTITQTSTISPTPTITSSWTASPTVTVTATPTNTQTITPTFTNSPVFSFTVTGTITMTVTQSVTVTITRTITSTSTMTVTPTITNTPVLIQLNKSMSENPAMLGDVVTFYLSYTNGGGSAATFNIWDTVPYVMNYVSCSCNGASGCAACTVDGTNRVVSWNLINVPAGGSGLVWFTASVFRLPYLMNEKKYFALENKGRSDLESMRLLNRDKIAGISKIVPRVQVSDL
jgi:hypothetical protein